MYTGAHRPKHNKFSLLLFIQHADDIIRPQLSSILHAILYLFSSISPNKLLLNDYILISKSFNWFAWKRNAPWFFKWTFSILSDFILTMPVFLFVKAWSKTKDEIWTEPFFKFLSSKDKNPPLVDKNYLKIVKN